MSQRGDTPQGKRPFLRLCVDGTCCRCTIEEFVEFFSAVEEDHQYDVDVVWMTQEEYDTLDEFEGF